ncbi:uncharacterized protein DS421_6g189430 [Arachis hypogaea]|nr:uncharacterized protein DS421_6g189430 [Arachis hypogaea]
MEFNSSCDQTNFLGYHPPSPIDYSNGGWEYHQEITDPEHSNSWRYASEPQDEQENHMGYFSPPQNDSSHYSNGGWEYRQEIANSEHSNPWRFAPEPQIDQANHMRCCPEPQNDLCHYPHGVWTYQQECEQSSEMNFLPEPQSEPCCYDIDTNYGWEGNFNSPNAIHQETSSLDYAFNKFMQDPSQGPQDCPYYDDFNNSSSCAWEEQNQKAFESPYSTYQEPSPLNYPTSPPNFSYQNSSPLEFASTQNSFQNSYNSIHHPQNSFHQPQNLFHNSQDSFHTTQNNLTTTHPYQQNFSQASSLKLVAEDLLQKSRELLERQEQSWEERESLFEKIDGHLEQIRKHFGLPSSEDEDQFVGEEVEKQEKEVHVSSEISMKNEVAENEIELEVIKEHEHSQPSQTSLESVIEKYEEEMKKSWEEQQTSSMIELLKQMLSVKEEVEEQEREKDTQEKSHSTETEKCKKEGLIEPPIQEAFDEKKTPTITQPPRLGFKEVKAINKSTKKRIVTKLSRTIFMKKNGSTTSNPPPDPASKLNQAINKRKLAEERPRQGTLAESPFSLRSFLLTNWKKRKKVNNMSTIGIISLLCFVFVLCFI